ncbi:glutaredoxin family protein [Candidatus Pacearchaeota archaeon]|nr:glutaredoxin family protein [Candidatus Pacearchaeota archaeon]
MDYINSIVKVPGKKLKNIFLFTLSTCGWCKKTKKLLSKLGLEYSYVDVDLLEEAKDEAIKDMKKYISEISFPLLVIDNTSISGYEEEKIREIINELK